MARECQQCHAHMAAYVPRKRVGGRLLCPACTSSPRGGYVSASVTPGGGAYDDESFEQHFNDQTKDSFNEAPQDGRRASDIAKDAQELHERYAGQPGTHHLDEDSDYPYYEIDHPSGWTAKTHGGPLLDVGHHATPGETHDVIGVGYHGESGHDTEKIHPLLTEGTPEQNHNNLASALSEWVAESGEDTARANPRIKKWQEMHGMRNEAMKKQAHDSGDGETIYHCFGPNTRYLTWDGVKTLKETVGTRQTVLASHYHPVEVDTYSRVGMTSPNTVINYEIAQEIRRVYTAGQMGQKQIGQRFGITQSAVSLIVRNKQWTKPLVKDGGGAGQLSGTEINHGYHETFMGSWVEAEIRSFGVQPLMKMTLQRNKRIKVIEATPEHRWFVAGKDRAHGIKRKMVLTADLKPGDSLVSLFPKSRIREGGRSTTPSPFGVAHGFVFGDGSRLNDGSKVELWGDKDMALLPYFTVSKTTPRETSNGVQGLQIRNLPAFFKEFPSRGESLSYLYGWLAGYFAADGSVGETGSVQLHCADSEVLEWVRTLCHQLGIGTHGIYTAGRQGYGDEPSDMSRLGLVTSTLTSDFFIIPEHRARFEQRGEREINERLQWTVVSVEDTGKVEEVYCAVVPGYENFTLDDNINCLNCPFCGSGQVIARSDRTIECEFCHTCFTVQVQPEFSAFPQTINGMPVAVPGMPGAVGEDPSQPMDPNAPPDPNADPNAAGAMAPGGAPENPDDEDTPAGDDSTGGNPFTSGLRTSAGRSVAYQDYLAHLAIATSKNRPATLAQVRSRRRS